MAGKDNSVAIRISADASGFRRGAQEATSGLDRLAEKLREHRAEEVQQSRATRFFATELQNLGAVSNEVAGELASIAGAFATGSGIGAAAEVVKLIGHAFMEARGESKKFAEETATDLRALQKQTDDYVESLKGEVASQKMARDLIDPLQQKAIQQQGVLAEKTDALADATNKLREAEQTRSRAFISDMKSLVQIRQAELDKAQEEFDKTQLVIKAKGVQVGRAGSAEDTERLHKLIQTSAEEMHRLEIAEAGRKVDDLAQDRQYYEKKTAEVTAFVTDKLAKEEQLALDEAQLLGDSLRQDREHYQQVTAQTTAILEKQFEKEDEAAKKLQHDLGHAVEQMGQAAGEAFLGMLDGSKSVEDSLVQLVAQMVEAALRMAALREIASGDFIGGGLLVAGSVIAGGLGSLTGGGGNSTNITVNNTNHIQGGSPSDISLTMERSIITAVRRMQARGRLT